MFLICLEVASSFRCLVVYLQGRRRHFGYQHTVIIRMSDQESLRLMMEFKLKVTQVKMGKISILPFRHWSDLIPTSVLRPGVIRSHLSHRKDEVRRIWQRRSFTKVIKFVSTQKLLKSVVLLKESGDVVLLVQLMDQLNFFFFFFFFFFCGHVQSRVCGSQMCLIHTCTPSCPPVIWLLRLDVGTGSEPVLTVSGLN